MILSIKNNKNVFSLYWRNSKEEINHFFKKKKWNQPAQNQIIYKKQEPLTII